MDKVYDVIIIGAGPAGLAAGLYCGRAKLNTLVFEKEALGGQVINIEKVENYPGYENGVPGPDLASSMLSQASNEGVELEMAEVQKIEPGKEYKAVHTLTGDYYGKTIIVASGSRHKKLGVPGEEELSGKGVFYCAVCDGSPYASKVVAVAGGGDAGITEALYLARMASRVIIFEAMPICTATSTLLERAQANPKIEIHCGTRIEKISGDAAVKELSLSNVKTGDRKQLAVDGILVHIGVIPNSECVREVLPLSNQGQILVNDRLQSEVPGIFAAGDVRAASPCQIVTAVGDGATAALSAQKYLSGLI